MTRTASGQEIDLREATVADVPLLLAFVDGRPVAYATYFFTFSTAAGRRGLWLEDLFVDPAFRGKGLGETLMARLAGIAVQHGCGRFEWIVLDWNESARRFYDRLGATLLAEWRMCRLDGARLGALAERFRRT